jgi:hypothetical protein
MPQAASATSATMNDSRAKEIFRKFARTAGTPGDMARATLRGIIYDTRPVIREQIAPIRSGVHCRTNQQLGKEGWVRSSAYGLRSLCHCHDNVDDNTPQNHRLPATNSLWLSIKILLDDVFESLHTVSLPLKRLENSLRCLRSKVDKTRAPLFDRMSFWRRLNDVLAGNVISMPKDSGWTTERSVHIGRSDRRLRRLG